MICFIEMHLPRMLFAVFMAHYVVPDFHFSLRKSFITDLMNIKMLPCSQWLHIYLILILNILYYFSYHITNVRICYSFHPIPDKMKR